MVNITYIDRTLYSEIVWQNSAENYTLDFRHIDLLS